MELTKAEQRTRTALAGLIFDEHPVALAVEPLREQAIERTKQHAKGVIESVRKELEEAGNDRNKCAPYPNGNCSQYTYRQDLSKYRLFCSLTETREDTHSYRPNDPHIVDMSPKRIAKFIQDAAERAAIDYDAFIVKLCGKIGTCDVAVIAGSHVWGYSRLAIAKGNTAEVWQTRQIINTSKLGTVFNQWPSRKVKN